MTTKQITSENPVFYLLPMTKKALEDTATAIIGVSMEHLRGSVIEYNMNFPYYWDEKQQKEMAAKMSHFHIIKIIPSVEKPSLSEELPLKEQLKLFFTYWPIYRVGAYALTVLLTTPLWIGYLLPARINKALAKINEKTMGLFVWIIVFYFGILQADIFLDYFAKFRKVIYSIRQVKTETPSISLSSTSATPPESHEIFSGILIQNTHSPLLFKIHRPEEDVYLDIRTCILKMLAMDLTIVDGKLGIPFLKVDDNITLTLGENTQLIQKICDFFVIKEETLFTCWDVKGESCDNPLGKQEARFEKFLSCMPYELQKYLKQFFSLYLTRN